MNHTSQGTAVAEHMSEKPGFLWKLLIQGPKLLLTTGISIKCAGMMMALSAPSLLVFSILTVPAILFQSPQQQAYFHFARILNEDPMRWLAFGLAGVCSLLALAVPAAFTDTDQPQHAFDRR
jgi:hypothetical protein